MKIGLLSNDILLKELLETTGLFSDITLISKIYNLNEFDVVIISDELIEHNTLISKLNGNEHKNIYYLITEQVENRTLQKIITVCKTKNISVLSPHLTLNQTVERIVKSLFPEIEESNKNVITLFGADSKVGVTMIATILGEVLEKQALLKKGVGVLFLNEKPNNLYFETKSNKGIENIKLDLLSQNLGVEELKNACIQREMLYMLPGPEYFKSFRQYDINSIEHLISTASVAFDVVLIDAGTNLDSGLAIAALNSTQNKYLVTTQQESAKVNFSRLESQALATLNLHPSDFYIIVNKYLEYREIYTDQEIADMYKMTLATSLPDMGNLGWQAEFDHKTLMHYEDSNYERQIYELIKLVAVQTNLRLIDNNKKPSGLINKLKVALKM